jgi:ureidoacrylate peracid hydrolase
VPKLVVGSMPWGEPPTKQDRQAKQGPPMQTIDKLYGSRSPTIQTGV